MITQGTTVDPGLVLTHYPRPSFTLADTTFHFLDQRCGARSYYRRDEAAIARVKELIADL